MDKDKQKKKKPNHTRLAAPGSRPKKTREQNKAVDKPLTRTLEAYSQLPTAEKSTTPSPAIFDFDNSVVEDIPPELFTGGVPVQEQQPSPQKRQPDAAHPRQNNKSANDNTTPKQQDVPQQDEKAEEPTVAEGVEKKRRSSKTIQLPPKNKRPGVVAAKRRKMWKRMRALAVLLLVAVVAIVFLSGAYMSIGLTFSEGVESLKIMAQGGDGFPMEFVLTNYEAVQSMGEKGFAAVGGQDVVITSAAGKELRRIQHGYVEPAITASDTRVCVYSRGGFEYIIEGRTKNLMYGATKNAIQLAEMSPGGWLALVTASNNRSFVDIYDPSLDGTPVFTWKSNTSTTETPISIAFHSNNRSVAVGCALLRDGTLGSAIYLFKTNRSAEKAKTGEIYVENAIPVQVEYLSQDRILVIYDTGFAGVYNSKGEEVSRFNYGTDRLATANVNGSMISLLFGSDNQETAKLVLLNRNMEEVFTASLEGVSNGELLTTPQGIFLLTGHEVRSFKTDGTEMGNYIIEGRSYGLVYGGQPLVIMAGEVDTLKDLMLPAEKRAAKQEKQAADKMEEVSSMPVTSTSTLAEEKSSGEAPAAS